MCVAGVDAFMRKQQEVNTAREQFDGNLKHWMKIWTCCEQKNLRKF